MNQRLVIKNIPNKKVAESIVKIGIDYGYEISSSKTIEEFVDSSYKLNFIFISYNNSKSIMCNPIDNDKNIYLNVDSCNFLSNFIEYLDSEKFTCELICNNRIRIYKNNNHLSTVSLKTIVEKLNLDK